MRKVLSILLSLVMFITFVPTVGYAAMGDYGGNETGATWYWPIHGYSSTSSAYSKITSSYGFRGGSYNRFHKGVDIGESLGTTVYPVRSGTVSVVDNSTGGSEGRSIIINHNDGYWSVYMHLSSINVKQGQSVTANTKIGAVGGSGYNSESYYAKHLHLGIHYGNSFNWECNVNPCPSGYTRIGDSLQTSAGGYQIGSASIAYSVNYNADDSNTDEPLTPGKPVFNNTKTIYTNEEEITFTWNVTSNTSYYNWYIDQYDANSEGYKGDHYVRLGHEDRVTSVTKKLPVGKYRVEVTAYNSKYYTDSDWYYFEVIDAYPGKPSFNNTKTTYTNEEEIAFTWNDTSNTSYYNWYIDQYDANSEGYSGDHYVRIGNALRIESVTRTLPIGKYRVHVVAYNSAHYKSSDMYYFEVIDAYPGKPSFNNTKTTYTNEEEITFTWNDTSNTSYYNWYIDQYDANSEGYSGDHYVRIGNEQRIKSVTRTLPIGKYRVHVVSYNEYYPYRHNSSDLYYFEVVEATSFTESIVTKKDSLYSVEITLHNFTTPYDILIVGYKGNQFITMKRIPHDKQNSPYTLEGDIDQIKVMVWDSLTTLKPLCVSEVIPISEWLGY